MTRLKICRTLIPYDPVQELTNENFVSKAILECLRNNDPEGVMEVIEMYLSVLEKSKNLTVMESIKS
jgi:DNA-binding phage protein